MHTPGPYYVDSFRQRIGDTGDYDNRCLIRTKGVAHPFPSWIAEISDCNAQEANANLFAAAPDLLAAVRHVIDYARNSRTGRMLTGDGFAMLEAAVAKAEARS